MDYRMQELLDLLKSNRLDDRKKAIDGLWEWDNVLEVEDSIKLLELAGQIWPISNEDWDDPSLALVRAGGIIVHKELVPVIEQNLLKYSFHAINRALSFLNILHTPEAIEVYKKFFNQYCLHGRLVPHPEQRNIILEKKEQVLTILEVMIENEVQFHPFYDDFYHFLVGYGLEHKYFTIDQVIIDKELIRERLQYLFDLYLQYDSDYNWKFVYEAWKQPYYEIRYSISTYLAIFSEITTDDEFLELDLVYDWKDPVIKLLYIELLFLRNLPVDNKIMQELLANEECCCKAYGIVKKYKPEWLPTDPSHQQYYVKECANFLFYNHDQLEKFPDEVEIMGKFENDDPIYGHSLTYYVVRFRSSDPAFAQKSSMRGLIGAFYSQNIPVAYSPSGLDDYYTDLVSWEEKSFEDHVADFKARIMEKHGTDELNQIHYLGGPHFKKRNNTIAILAFFASFGLLWLNDWFTLGLLVVPLWLLLTFLHVKRLGKNVAVQIREHHMDYFNFQERTYVLLDDIATVKFEKKWVEKSGRFFLLPLRKWHFNFYDHGGNLIYSIPRDYFQEEYFFMAFKNQTLNLMQPPVLEWEQAERLSA